MKREMYELIMLIACGITALLWVYFVLRIVWIFLEAMTA